MTRDAAELSARRSELAMMNIPEHYCTFYLDGARYGVVLDSIRDIVPCRGMVPLMRSQSGARGLLPFRGEHVLVIDLGQVLQGNFLQLDSESAMALIVDGLHGPMGLMVDGVGEVVRGRVGLEFGVGPWAPHASPVTPDGQPDTLTVLDVDGIDLIDPEIAA
ncbi:MAG: chemotaxis protein CheW [Myxococcales bacterium FL481]|nr:MAG: chemotaxis protein CheW [Myxococcales bacterium FL481]